MPETLGFAISENKQLSKHYELGTDGEWWWARGKRDVENTDDFSCIFVSSFLNLVLRIFVAVLCSLHSGISKTLYTIFRGEN